VTPAASIRDRLVIGSWFTGPAGRGQGGWTAAKLAERIGRPVMVWLRAAVPLDTELEIVELAGSWQCRRAETVVLDARPWTPDIPDTGSVTVEEAADARTRFPFTPEDHPVPTCFSCGTRPDGMGVHAGPLAGADGDEVRFAADWTVPNWALGDDGQVDPAVLWAALDCTSGFYACCHPRFRSAFTAGYAVEVVRRPEPGETLALVAWPGDGEPDWDGRKRTAAGIAFDPAGQVVARARSFWIAVDAG
jgi:hypothetical protein